MGVLATASQLARALYSPGAPVRMETIGSKEDAQRIFREYKAALKLLESIHGDLCKEADMPLSAKTVIEEINRRHDLLFEASQNQMVPPPSGEKRYMTMPPEDVRLMETTVRILTEGHFPDDSPRYYSVQPGPDGKNNFMIDEQMWQHFVTTEKYGIVRDDL